MKLISVDRLKGDEVLARAVMTKNYSELLAAGTKLKPEYINKLIDDMPYDLFIFDYHMNTSTTINDLKNGDVLHLIINVFSLWSSGLIENITGQFGS